MENRPTVAAVSTPNASGGVSMIRVSGSSAIEICNRIFNCADGSPLTASKGYRAHFGRVVEDGAEIDEAVCLVFRSPHSYTGEDVAEITCHGGMYITRRVLRAVLNAGAQPAGPGEFTKRAFLNGRIDLTQAEAVAGLISAHGEQSARAALCALDGSLSKKISACARILTDIAAHLSAWADYPDEEIEVLSPAVLCEQLNECLETLSSLLADCDAGSALTSGVDTAIIGKPNVGKSALMNLISGRERSIVTSYAGTTRDVVEDTVVLGDVLLRLADTAGIRDTDDPVEKIGVERARVKIARAQLVIAVFDGSDEPDARDFEILDLCRGKLTLAVVNKTDLPLCPGIERLCERVDRTVFVSALNGTGLEELKAAVSQLLGTDKIDPSAAILASERQILCCRQAHTAVLQALEALNSGLTLDAVNVSITDAISALLELTGENASQAVIDTLFSHFCVGK